MTSIIDAVYLSNSIEMIKLSRLPVSNPILETESSVLYVIPIAFTEEIRQENMVEISDDIRSSSTDVFTPLRIVNMQRCIKHTYEITETVCVLSCACGCYIGLCGLVLYGPFWLLNILC